jgi:hypothetical protein
LESVEQDDVVPVNAVLRLQESWVDQRVGAYMQQGSTSQGAPLDLGDGTPAVLEAEAEVMGPDEDV